ncbi:MAG: B12-binding domain-containing protein [Acidimicrobiia bacterium]|nr:B12-binding domain-containing protein [Acidimicrobiia bacterium]MDX2466093.1 B12-binding domain-containing protein [Acidimicrobiia bacterium]
MQSLTLQEVADELGVHYMTVYRYVRLGYLPAAKAGASWGVTRADLDDFKKEPAAVSGRGGSNTAWDERLLQRLLAADQAGSWKVVEAAQASGMSVRDVYLQMIVPAMNSVGQQWVEGKVSIAQEHAASQVVVRIVSRLSATVTRRGVSKGVIVLGTPAGETHTLPVMIAADLIRTEGFDVLDLGSDLPAESFAEIAAAQQRLVAVGVSATRGGQVDDIKTTIAELRKRVDVPIFLGGSAIDGDEHAKLLGAEFGASSAEDILPKLLDLVS